MHSNSTEQVDKKNYKFWIKKYFQFKLSILFGIVAPVMGCTHKLSFSHSSIALCYIENKMTRMSRNTKHKERKHTFSRFVA